MVPVTSMMLWFVLLMMKMVKSVKAQNNDNLVETGDCQLSQVDVVLINSHEHTVKIGS